MCRCLSRAWTASHRGLCSAPSQSCPAGQGERTPWGLSGIPGCGRWGHAVPEPGRPAHPPGHGNCAALPGVHPQQKLSSIPVATLQEGLRPLNRLPFLDLLPLCLSWPDTPGERRAPDQAPMELCLPSGLQ